MKPGRHAVRAGEQVIDAVVTVDGRVEIGDETWTLRPIGASAWLVASSRGQRVVHAYADGPRMWLHIDGAVHVVEVDTPESMRTRPRAVHASDLAAPMPAVVRAVLVSPGDRVEAGHVLVMLEAMKMELPVRAPRAAAVVAVCCVPGELVQPGVPLVELE